MGFPKVLLVQFPAVPMKLANSRQLEQSSSGLGSCGFPAGSTSGRLAAANEIGYIMTIVLFQYIKIVMPLLQQEKQVLQVVQELMEDLN